MATSTIQVAEMAIATFAAAGIASYLVLKLTNGSRSEESKYNYHPYPRTTFLQNDRTIIPNDDAVLAQPRGWSMEDALKSAKDGSARAKAMTPAQVLQSLQKGNSRFWTGQAQRPEVSAFERRVLIKQQFPSTAILGCSDSRVPVEIVFDQGLGDMFVVRVAGNCLGPTTQASLDYAVHHLSVKVLMIMGHEGCGAIKAAGLPQEMINKETKSLSAMLTNLKTALSEVQKIADPRALDRECVVSNVRRQVTDIVKDPQLMESIKSGNLIIVGAFYEISSGIVDFFMQVSKFDGKDKKPSPGVQSRYFPETGEIVQV
jgi:carbonic anhydrase